MAMKGILQELRWNDLISSAKIAGRGAYAVIAILLALLIGVIVIAVMGWSAAAGTEVPLAGYFAMAIGVTASLVVGIGLMALVFYSSRAGYDEPAKLVEPSERDEPNNDGGRRA
jgi:hypothetical protein